eukprot:g19907.t1
MCFAEVFGVEIGDYHLNQESEWDCLSKRAVAQLDKKRPQVLWRTACNANFRMSQLWQADSKHRYGLKQRRGDGDGLARFIARQNLACAYFAYSKRATRSRGQRVGGGLC